MGQRLEGLWGKKNQAEGLQPPPPPLVTQPGLLALVLQGKGIPLALSGLTSLDPLGFDCLDPAAGLSSPSHHMAGALSG